MITTNLRTATALLAAAALIAFGPALAGAGDPPVETVEAAPVDAQPVESSSPSLEAARKFGDGMQIPVDGSSLEAFDKSLEGIKEQASEAEYTTLVNAIDYLLIYDLAARRDRAKLAASLDGLTGEQIVDKVHWRKGNKYR